jgi:predicted DNA-binding transcriptional regulator AlpA
VARAAGRRGLLAPGLDQIGLDLLAHGHSLAEVLLRKELAAALGVSTRTVDRWIHEQTGPPATLLPSGRRRWRWGEVETWLRQRREGE